MDEIQISGSKYISSRRAARESGYVSDYIGQLIRSGKLKAVKIGRSWFIDEKSLKAVGGGLSIQKTTPEGLVRQVSVATVKFPKTWSEVVYLSDGSPLLPISDKRDTLQIRRSEAMFIDSGIKTRDTSVSAVVDGIRVQSSSRTPIIVHAHEERGQKAGRNIARILLSSLLVSMIVFLIPVVV